jgi:hypothetical protein
MKTICLDFDGVIKEYKRGWRGGAVDEPPVKGSLEAIKKLIDSGFIVVIFTARYDLRPVRMWLSNHLEEKFGRIEGARLNSLIRITNSKPPANLYIDDRAIRFESWEILDERILEK